MRILVACHDCQRKYDATKSKIGSRFRCHCGELLTVQAPRGHEAGVVRCSSCGSPREEGINRCGYCDADFTIHERDLNTVCPDCLARVSDRARYCADCGSVLAAEMVAGETSESCCPACEDRVQLVSRRLSEARVSVLECPMCTGLWLGISSFTTLRDNAVRKSSHVHLSTSDQPRLKRSRNEPRVRYRSCVICAKLMHRRQYGRGSGVVIDTCRDHGIWFDGGELRQVLEWIRLGGRTGRPLDAELRKQQLHRSLTSQEPAVTEKRIHQPERLAEPKRPPRDFLDNVVEGLLTHLGNLFD